MSEEKATLSEREQQIQEMEEYISNLEKLIEQKKQAENLIHNKEFQTLILGNYCQREVTRCLRLALIDELPKENREEALAMAEDGCKLQVFLDTILKFGAIAERDMPDARKALVELESTKED